MRRDWCPLHRLSELPNVIQSYLQWMTTRNAIGTTVVVHTTQGDRFRYVTGGGSYLSQSAYTVHAGLPEGAELQGVTVYWPSGKVDEVQSITSLNQMYNLIE